MRHALVSLALALCAALPAGAEECPPAPDHTKALHALIAEANAAPNAAAGRDVSNRMWAHWTDAPDAAALALRSALTLNPWLGERSLLPMLEADEQEL